VRGGFGKKSLAWTGETGSLSKQGPMLRFCDFENAFAEKNGGKNLRFLTQYSVCSQNKVLALEMFTRNFNRAENLVSFQISNYQQVKNFLMDLSD
jgi:hypothetical protein